jgi:hypothetical protein
MEVDGKGIRIAVPHRLMISPDTDSPLVGMRLLQQLLAGPQDLTIADGANDNGRRILEWSGASMSHLYSLNWVRPLRPCVFAIEMARKRLRGMASFGAAIRPVGRVIDSVLRSPRVSPFGVTRPTTRDVEVSADLVLKGIEQFSRGRILRPVYDLHAVEWLLKALGANKDRGEFGGMGVFNSRDQFIGVCLYYMTTARIGEVMLLAARDDSRDTVLRHVIYSMQQRRGIGLIGRLEPMFLPNFADNHCLMKCGDWAFFHGRNQELVNMINGGDAFLSPLDGELWLRSPMDRL